MFPIDKVISSFPARYNASENHDALRRDSRQRKISGPNLRAKPLGHRGASAAHSAAGTEQGDILDEGRSFLAGQDQTRHWRDSCKLGPLHR